jgi:glyoxylase-like metal-dependent hydrolase (beta-lactamase superfamily II)
MSKSIAHSIHVISDGFMKIDGGSVFGQIPKVIWEKKVKADRLNRISLGLNCLLVRTPEGNVLIDTGAGNKEMGNIRESFGLSTSKLNRNLKEQGLGAKDIDLVILTHLHFDHSGGCTKIDRTGKAIPAFPRAKYFVQQNCWDAANHPNERSSEKHYPEDFKCLEEFDQLKLLNGHTEIMPGIKVWETGGHCSGHQIVQINCGGEKVMYLGDVIPTPYHLDLPNIPAYDENPEDTLKQKRELLHEAAKDGWLVIFGHGNGDRAGYLELRGGDITLRKVNL